MNRDRLKVIFDQSDQALDLHVLVLGCDLKTDVCRGENRGKQLKQQFVSLANKSANNEWAVKIPDVEKQEDARLALALFVTKSGSQTPLQATGTWLVMD